MKPDLEQLMQTPPGPVRPGSWDQEDPGGYRLVEPQEMEGPAHAARFYYERSQHERAYDLASHRAWDELRREDDVQWNG